MKPVADFTAPHAQRVYEVVTGDVWTNVLRHEGAYYYDERISIEL